MSFVPRADCSPAAAGHGGCNSAGAAWPLRSPPLRSHSSFPASAQTPAPRAARAARLSRRARKGLRHRDVTARRGRGGAGRRRCPARTWWWSTSRAVRSCGCTPSRRASCCSRSATRSASAAATRRSRRARSRSRAAAVASRRRGARAAERRAAFSGDVFVRAIDVLTGIAEDKAADFVASKVVRAFDWQGRTPACTCWKRRLLESAAREGDCATSPPATMPSLVLIHGTFSQTTGTFGKLWTEHPQLVQRLFTGLRRQCLRARSPDARRQPDRQRDHARRGRARQGAASSADALARRSRRRSAGARVRPTGCDAWTAVFKADGRARRELKRLAAIVARQDASRSSASCASPVRRAARCSRPSGSTPTCRC